MIDNPIEYLTRTLLRVREEVRKLPVRYRVALMMKLMKPIPPGWKR